MGLRCRRRINLGGGVRLNLDKKSVGISVGGKGFRYSVSSSGRRTATVGIPGTGLSHVASASSGGRKAARAPGRATAPVAARGPAALPKPGLFAPRAEKRLYAGVQACFEQEREKALRSFEEASARDGRNVSDDFFAGVVAMQLGDPNKATANVERVVTSEVELPDPLMHKYLPPDRVHLTLELAITPRVSAAVGFDSLGAALILAEIYQEAGRREEAIGLLQRLAPELRDDEALRQAAHRVLGAEILPGRLEAGHRRMIVGDVKGEGGHDPEGMSLRAVAASGGQNVLLERRDSGELLGCRATLAASSNCSAYVPVPPMGPRTYRPAKARHR